MDDMIVLYPSPGMGHLISMVELGKLILTHHPSFSITILILTPPYSTGSTSSYISSVSSALPSLSFLHLPPLSLPPSSADSVEELALEFPRLNNLNLHQSLQSLSQTSNLKALIMDFFNDAAFEVSSTLNIPTYYFFTSAASALANLLYLPTIHKTTTTNLKDLNTLVVIPGLPPIPSSDMPTVVLVRDTKIYRSLLGTAAHMTESNGILVNTYTALETKAMKALSDGLCVPERPTPPVFSIGPLIASDGQGGDDEAHECLRWLSTQPSKSVVFLSFGSMGLLSSKQLKEIAIGLEKSGQRFLWVVRAPPREVSKSQSIVAPPEPDLDELLPVGFLERTKGRGMVVKSWAPQVAVLSHNSVGGFVTHCGWNSVLEAICAGVPMIAWPLYADQRMTRVVLVEEIKAALAVKESGDGLVSGAELEERVKELMESKRGREVRERVLGLRESGIRAMKDGGSSIAALNKLAELWKGN